MKNRFSNKKGFTLVEVLISMVVLVIVSLGLIQASLLTIDYNMRNELRDEGARVAAEAMARLRATRYTDPVLNDTSTVPSDNTAQVCGPAPNNLQLTCLGAGLQPTPATGWVIYNANAAGVTILDSGAVQRTVRLLTQPYCRCMRITNIDTTNPTPTVKRVEIAAIWIDPKGETHRHTVSANLRAQ